MKDKLLKNTKKNKKRGYFQTFTAMLALVTTLNGCALGKHQNEEQVFASVVPSIERMMEIPDMTIDETVEEDFVQEDKLEIPVEPEEEKKAVITIEQEVGKNVDVKTTLSLGDSQQQKDLFIPDLSNSSYDKCSIVDALKSVNCRYDFEYRTQLANYFGIENYKGTIEQNPLLLYYLRTYKIVENDESNHYSVDHNSSNYNDHEISIDKDDIPNDISNDNNNNINGNDSSSNDELNKPTISIPSIKEEEEEHEHCFLWTAVDDMKEQGKCSCGEIIERPHQYQNWKYTSNGMEGNECTNCKHIMYRDHAHGDISDDLYVFDHSNNDGTHVLVGTDHCDMCGQDLQDVKTEDCVYERTYKQTGINDIHTEVDDCLVCGDHKEQQGSCVPTGDIQYVKIYSQIYEYRECELCHDMAEREYHVNHVYGDWESKGSKTHIRYCGCIEAREEENHNLRLETEDGLTYKICDDCHYKELVPQHEHDKKYESLWEFLNHMDPTNYPDTDFNQNPTLDEYCFKLIYDCPYCGGPYTIVYDHHFVLKDDGITYECDACTITYVAENIRMNNDVIESDQSFLDNETPSLESPEKVGGSDEADFIEKQVGITESEIQEVVNVPSTDSDIDVEETETLYTEEELEKSDDVQGAINIPSTDLDMNAEEVETLYTEEEIELYVEEMIELEQQISQEDEVEEKVLTLVITE